MSQSSGYVRHISIVATLLMIHGVLLLVCGCAALAVVGAFTTLPEITEKSDPFSTMMVKFVYGAVGGTLSLIGCLQLIAGIRNHGFRSRLLGLVALGAGILPLFTIWCGPTSLALTIYGLVVYFQPDCEHAFALRREGFSKEEILNRLDA